MGQGQGGGVSSLLYATPPKEVGQRPPCGGGGVGANLGGAIGGGGPGGAMRGGGGMGFDLI